MNNIVWESNGLSKNVAISQTLLKIDNENSDHRRDKLSQYCQWHVCVHTFTLIYNWVWY